MDAGYRSVGGLYVNEDNNLQKEELYFKMNCNMADFGND